MARLVPIGLALMIGPLYSPAEAADPPGNPWLPSEQRGTARDFNMRDHNNMGFGMDSGSRIIAGTELMPNGVLGIGMFGQKADRSQLGPATARDLAVPKQRRVAVGFSLRF